MATLDLSARAANSMNLTLGAGGGETAWEIEVNRAADFFSDESYFVPQAASGVRTISDLVPDTPYYFRARKTNGGNGPWTPTVMAATLVPTQAVVPYTGFTIVPAILVVPEPINEPDLAATNVEAGSSVLNLLNDDPASVLKVAGTGSAITFRTTGRSIDTFALLGSAANENVTWRIRGGTSAANVTAAPTTDTGVVNFRINPGIGRRPHYHAFRQLAAPVTTEYWRIDIAGVTANWFARHMVVGLARSSVNISRGAGRAPMDLGQFQRTQLGSPDRVRGWRGETIDFPLSWLKESEYETKWSDLMQLVGTTEPVLAIPNPKSNVYLNDRIAYGVIADARDENMRSDRYAKTLTIASLY